MWRVLRPGLGRTTTTWTRQTLPAQSVTPRVQNDSCHEQQYWRQVQRDRGENKQQLGHNHAELDNSGAQLEDGLPEACERFSHRREYRPGLAIWQGASPDG